MKALRCDRCDRYYMPYKGKPRIHRQGSTLIEEYYDLCPDCKDELVAWFNRWNKVVEPEVERW